MLGDVSRFSGQQCTGIGVPTEYCTNVLASSDEAVTVTGVMQNDGVKNL